MAFKGDSLAFKVLVVAGDGAADVKRMFESENWIVTNDIDEADLVQFVGGADVDPGMYGQRLHKTTFSDIGRDAREEEIYKMALDRGIPMAGICRGGQFLNVMNGGTMHQDVDGHNRGNHQAWLAGAVLPITVTSTHHQMMEPNWEECQILMKAKQSSVKRRMSDLSSVTNVEYAIHVDNKGVKATDIEALYYPGTHCLCFQPHPEYGNANETKEVYFIFLERYLFASEMSEHEQEQQA